MVEGRRVRSGLCGVAALATMALATASAQAESFELTLNEAYLNVGSDEGFQNLHLLSQPDTATLAGTINPATGNFTIPAGEMLPPKSLDVPYGEDATIGITIHVLTSAPTVGHWDPISGVLTMSATFAPTVDIPSVGSTCAASTTPATVSFSTSNDLGAHLGDEFDDPAGLDGNGAIAAAWTDVPVSGSDLGCGAMNALADGPGGVWLARHAALPGNDDPTADFTFDPASPQTGQTVAFHSTSTDSDGTIEATEWDLDGDGAYDDASGQNATQSFASAGAHTVGIRVTDDDGGFATATKTVIVAAAPGDSPPASTPKGTTGLKSALQKCKKKKSKKARAKCKRKARKRFASR